VSGFWINPFGKQVVVKMFAIDIKRSDIIEAPDGAEEWEAIQTGYVMAVGPEAPTDVRVGDAVLFSKYDGQLGPSPGNNEQYVVLPVDKVWGKLDLESLRAEVDRRKAARAAEDEAARASIAQERARLVTLS
jgi:co-chaperonin GroES (HSP10)